MLYQAYQNQSDLMAPLRLLAQAGAASFWLGKTEGSPVRKAASAMDVLSRLKLTHTRPDYGIHAVQVGEAAVPVTEHKVLELPFGSLLHFGKDPSAGLPWQPPVLLVAPLSGHFATLLRETARTLLQDHDVYITDWHNARDVALRHGPFALDDYISHMIRFLEAVGPGAHVVSVCQPCVAALAATAIMAEGDVEKANVIRLFYDEYLAVNDLPAEFYLETVEKVFQTYDLARGVLRYRGRTVDPSAIRRTALMTVEGERDDICSVGQTVAAQDLCPNSRPYLKTHHVQTGVGHYGVFSGRKWNQQIYPRVREHIHASAG